MDDLTITGAGMHKTILNFASQIGGSEGFLVTGNGAILRDFAIEDTKGDAIKSKGVDGIGFVRMRVDRRAGCQQRSLRILSCVFAQRVARWCCGHLGK